MEEYLSSNSITLVNQPDGCIKLCMDTPAIARSCFDLCLQLNLIFMVLHEYALPTIQYELKEAERLFYDFIKNPCKPAARVREFEAELNRVRQVLVYEVFRLTEDRVATRYIQFHQYAVIRLLNETSGIQNKSALGLMEDLLLFLEKQFPLLFDHDVDAPTAFIIRMQVEWAGRVTQLGERMQAVHAEAELLDLALYVPTRMLQISLPTFTFRRMKYMKTITTELTRILEICSVEKNIDERIRTVLYDLNYNSKRFLTWHAQFVKDMLKSAETSNDKLERLSLLRKQIGQSLINPALAYDVMALPLQTQLISYVDQEIQYYEKVQQLRAASNDLLQGKQVKVRVNLSVAQLACIIRTGVDMGIIQMPNVTELLHAAAAVFVTRKAEQISYDSMKRRYYDIESGTWGSVQEFFAGMKRHADQKGGG